MFLWSWFQTFQWEVDERSIQNIDSGNLGGFLRHESKYVVYALFSQIVRSLALAMSVKKYRWTLIQKYPLTLYKYETAAPGPRSCPRRANKQT